MALVHYNEKVDEPSSFEAHVEHAWWDAMEIGLEPIMDVVIESCVDGYKVTYKLRQSIF